MEGEDPVGPQDQTETKVTCRMGRVGEMVFLKEEFPPHYLNNTKAGEQMLTLKLRKGKTEFHNETDKLSK